MLDLYRVSIYVNPTSVWSQICRSTILRNKKLSGFTHFKPIPTPGVALYWIDQLLTTHWNKLLSLNRQLSNPTSIKIHKPTFPSPSTLHSSPTPSPVTVTFCTNYFCQWTHPHIFWKAAHIFIVNPTVYVISLHLAQNIAPPTKSPKPNLSFKTNKTYTY